MFQSSIFSRPMDALAEGRSLAPESLWRRYSEFELLRNYLIVTYPYIVAPPLPEKRVGSLSRSFLCSQTREDTVVPGPVCNMWKQRHQAVAV